MQGGLDGPSIPYHSGRAAHSLAGKRRWGVTRPIRKEEVDGSTHFRLGRRGGDGPAGRLAQQPHNVGSRQRSTQKSGGKNMGSRSGVVSAELLGTCIFLLLIPRSGCGQ